MPTPTPVKVLVVDDNDANRYAVSRILRGRGVEVMEANTGNKASEMARNGPDIVLMDIHLPDMTAYDVLERLRSDKTTQIIPVILMSAVEPAPHARSMAQRLGVHSFLTLPVVADDLWIVIQAAMRKVIDSTAQPSSD
jgi:CheY-like chemotaxis protein